MHFHIYSTFKKKLNFFRKKTFLIAVSGGPDSLALTALAKSYSYENKCKIIIPIDCNTSKNMGGNSTYKSMDDVGSEDIILDVEVNTGLAK